MVIGGKTLRTFAHMMADFAFGLRYDSIPWQVMAGRSRATGKNGMVARRRRSAAHCQAITRSLHRPFHHRRYREARRDLPVEAHSDCCVFCQDRRTATNANHCKISNVIPGNPGSQSGVARPGIQEFQRLLATGFHRHDGITVNDLFKQL